VKNGLDLDLFNIFGHLSEVQDDCSSLVLPGLENTAFLSDYQQLEKGPCVGGQTCVSVCVLGGQDNI
jgi:hypothetical protein